MPADDLYLSGTAELILNSLRADEILSENELPILYAGFSPCFRREAGAAGKDTRGLVRVHQFMKTEQFVICKNDVNESDKWHKKLLAISEEVLQDLELPYQVLDICTGDMGAPMTWRLGFLPRIVIVKPIPAPTSLIGRPAGRICAIATMPTAKLNMFIH